jgi:phospholipid/cholesterol/gamma-HCH transport system ATP-binding protein
VEKKLGRQKVLRGVDLEIRKGENMVIIGRSGGGKSVLLKHIIGLMQPDAGQVWFRDKDMAQLTEEQMVPLRKETGMLFQNGALFDSLTVGENVAFPLREQGRALARRKSAEVDRRAEDRRPAQPGAQMALGVERRHAQAGRPGAGRHRQAGPDALR